MVPIDEAVVAEEAEEAEAERGMRVWRAMRTLWEMSCALGLSGVLLEGFGG